MLTPVNPAPRTNAAFKPLALLAGGIAICAFSSCATHQAGGEIVVHATDGYQQNHGPFNSNGDYIEQWADNPPRRKYVSRDWAGELPKWKRKSPPKITARPAPRTSYSTPAPTYRPQPSYTQPSSSRPKVSTPSVARTKPTPPARKPVAPKPKPKPVIVHTVKRGDTLYALSRKYNVSINAIQKANGLKGTNIGIGKRLTIPK